MANTLLRFSHTIKSLGSVVTPPVSTTTPNLLTVRATYTAAPTNPSVSSADFPLGHSFGVTLMDDDGGIVEQGYSQLIRDYSYPDNAGGTRQVGLGLALNGKGNTLHDGSNPSVMSFQQLKALFDADPNVVGLNHTADHTNNGGTGTASVQTAMDELALNQSIFTDQIGYTLGGIVIPGGYAFFAQAAINLGSPIVSAGYDFTGQGQPLADGHNDWVSYVDGISVAKYYAGPVPLNTRLNADNLFVAGVSELKNQVNQHLTNAIAANDKRVFAIFTHTPNTPATFSAIREFIAYCLSLNNGNIWMGNIQQFWDFKTVAQKAVISTPAVSTGNQVTFTIDRAQLPVNTRYWDMSLYLKGGTLSNVTVDGADGVTFNPATGLINIRSYNHAVRPLGATVTTPPVVIVTPMAPTVYFNTSTRVLSWQHDLGVSQLERSDDGGASWFAYADKQVDDNAHGANSYLARVKAATQRTVSASKGNDAISAKVTTPTTPVTPGVDNDPFFARWNTGTRLSGKIPYDGLTDVYCVNNVRDEEGMVSWTDGTLTKEYNGAPKLRDELEPTRFRIDLRKYRANVSSIRIFSRDWTASEKFYYIPKGSFTRQFLGEVQPNAGWVTMTLPQPTDVCWLENELGVFYDSVSEFEVYGSWIAPEPFTVSPPRVKFQEMLRVNAFPWNMLNGDDPKYSDPNKLDLLKSTGGMREYLDWVRIEPVQGQYMFGPMSNDYGSWNHDTYLQTAKDNNLPVTVCTKNSPPWISASWPADMRTTEQLTVMWQGSWPATLAWAEKPEAYLPQALMLGQLVMRNGPVAVDPSRLKVYHRADGAFPSNAYLTGLDTLDVIETNNESDSWWRGRQGYATGRMQAARDSACYDGDQGRLGTEAGIKCIGNTRIKMSVAGRAVATLEHERGYKDWCREHRGYKADGSIDYPFDYLNYHAYATDAGITQSGNITRGLAPELANYTDKVNAYTSYSAEWCQNRGVIIGEFGYDISQRSSQSAIRSIDLLRDASGNVLFDTDGTRRLKPETTTTVIMENQLDWSLRTAHECHAAGVLKLEWYMFEDASTPYSDYDRYSACGMINTTTTPGGVNTRRPTAFGYHQVKGILANFYFDSIVSQNPRVHKLHNPTTNQDAYVLWSPTETAVVTSYNLNLSGAATYYTINSNSLTPTSQSLAAGTRTITVTERPCYVLLNIPT
jgi:hypothetical protein